MKLSASQLLVTVASATLLFHPAILRADDHATSNEVHATSNEVHATSNEVHATSNEVHATSNEVHAIVVSVNNSLLDGKHSEAGQADNLKAMDAFLARHQAEKTEDVAQVLYLKSILYAEIFKDPDKGTTLIQQLERDFPETAAAKKADTVLATLKGAERAPGVAVELVAKEPFSDFDVKDMDDHPLSAAAYKGKIVMIDFWATWCGPCVAEVPNVAAVYKKYHDKGFEIIGVSLDREGDKQKVLDFTQSHDMPWRQYYDGQFWHNALAVKYGINSIPSTILLDREGRVIAFDVRGENLAPTIAKALGLSE